MGGLGNVLYQLNYGEYLKTLGYQVDYIDTLTKKNLMTKILGWKIHDQAFKDILDIPLSNPSYLALALSKANISNAYSSYLTEWSNSPPRHTFGYFQNKERSSECYLNLNLSQNGLEANGRYMHIRLRDNNFLDESIEYYESILEQISGDENTFFLTDDINKTSRLIKKFDFKKSSVVSSTVINDFLILASCKSMILSPSTFSWWAAKLNKKLETVVIPNFYLEETGHFSRDFRLKKKCASSSMLQRV